MPLPIRSLVLLALCVAPACAQQQKQSKTPEPVVALATDGLAGQLVAVLPLTMVVSDARLPGATGLEARTRTMRWTDSLLADVLLERAPEVQWILPPALRRTAERAVGIMPSPDNMGQSVMRSSALRSVPDPLRAYLRQLVALSGGARFALIPAVLYLSPGPADSITVQLSAVLADGRLGRVVWRTMAKGTGETSEQALRMALATILASDAPASSYAMTYAVTLIPGDGIGPEITEQTVRVLEATGLGFSWDVQQAGMAAVGAGHDPLPDATIESVRRLRVALKGPLTTPVGGGYRSVNVALRKEFDLFANVRPAVTVFPGRYDGIDIVLVRENVEGLYSGVEHFIKVGDDPRAVGVSQAIVTRYACERVIRYAFEYAVRHGRKKIAIVHKANILKMASGLFLEVGRAISEEYAGRVASSDMIVDNCAMQLVLRPEQFDVIVTTNLFGDILSDEIAGLVGGLGLTAGGNIGVSAAIFEAVHGSAPDIAGKGVANPSAQILAGAMMLDHLGETAAGTRVRRAVTSTIRDAGIRTRDLGGTATTREFGDAVTARLV